MGFRQRVLLIDDVRTESDLSRKIDVIARNYWEGLAQLKENGPWDVLLLDHDLNSFDENGHEKTGYDIACWLEENPSYLPEEVKCVSGNPIGADRIMTAIDSARLRKDAPN